VVGGEKVARPIVSKCLVDQSAQPESDSSMQRFSSNLWCVALSVALGENIHHSTKQLIFCTEPRAHYYIHVAMIIRGVEHSPTPIGIMVV
jgi:hypothetical protein